MHISAAKPNVKNDVISRTHQALRGHGGPEDRAVLFVHRVQQRLQHLFLVQV